MYDILARDSSVVSRGSNDLGHLTSVEHSIDTGDTHPIRVPPRRLPFERREEVQVITAFG